MAWRSCSGGLVPIEADLQARQQGVVDPDAHEAAVRIRHMQLEQDSGKARLLGGAALPCFASLACSDDHEATVAHADDRAWR